MTTALLRQLTRPTRFANHHSRLTRGILSLLVSRVWRLGTDWLADGEATVIRFSCRAAKRFRFVSAHQTGVTNHVSSKYGCQPAFHLRPSIPERLSINWYRIHWIEADVECPVVALNALAHPCLNFRYSFSFGHIIRSRMECTHWSGQIMV